MKYRMLQPRAFPSGYSISTTKWKFCQGKFEEDQRLRLLLPGIDAIPHDLEVVSEEELIFFE